MKLEQFIYIQEIAQCHSISKAAKNLYISQPTISNAINQLEIELGFKLLHRNTAGVLLTAEGEKVLQSAQVILSEISHLKSSLADMKLTDHIRLSIDPALCNSILTEAMINLKRQHPAINVLVYEHFSSQALSAINQRTVQIGIVGVLADEKDSFESLASQYHIATELLYEDYFCFHLSSANPLVNQEVITLDDIKDYPLYTFIATMSSHCELQVAQIHRQFKSTYGFNNRELIKKSMIENNGVAYLPSLFARNDFFYQNGLLTTRNVEQCHFPFYVYLIYPDHIPLTSSKLQLIDAIQELL